MKYVHGISGKEIFAEVARKAIEDEFGDNIEQTYLKKTEKPTYQYNEDGEIIGINGDPIAAGTASIPLKGADGVYVQHDLTANIVGISANYAYASALSSYQQKLSDETMTDIYSIPFKLDKSEFESVSSTFATKDYVTDKIAEIGSPLVIRGSKTCAEIEALTGMKVGDVYCVKDSGTIDGMTVLARDEVAWTDDNEWIVVGREIAVDLSDYYKKSETSGAGQIDAALANIDVKFEDYYTTTETSGKDQISEALASKVDSTAMTAYYTKDETSGAEEIATALAGKLDPSALDDYVTTNTLASNYYDKTETSSKEELQSAFDNKADLSELELYYTMAETSGADQLSAAFDTKLDTTAFSTVSSTFLTDADISAADWNDTTDVVRTNSAAWAEGGAGDPEVNALVHSNSGIWNSVSDKLDSTAFSTVSSTFLTETSADELYAPIGITAKLDTIEEGAQKNVQSNWTETNTASDAYIKNKPDIYTKSEVDTLLNGKIVVVEQLPATGDSSKIYYVGPNTSVSGDDKYDEYLWYENDWLHVGEHSIDLSDYATYEYVDALTDGKQDTLSWSYDGNTLTAINGSAIKDTTYTAGENIDITNNVISGKDWSGEIEAAVADKADNQDVEDLADEMAEGMAGLSEEIATKLESSAFAEVSGTFLTKTSADTLYQPIGDYATTGEVAEKLDITAFNETLDDINDAFNDVDNLIDQVSASIKGTILTGDSNIRATSAEEGNNIKWTLELTAQPVVTDTTLSGYSGIVATKDSTVSSQWNVGLTEPFYNVITGVSSIQTITKNDVDEIWAIVTGCRAGV